MELDTLVAYILVWPVLSAGILILLIASLIRDIVRARRDGEELL
ncbi:MAG TPA: putative transporter small subunit [Paenalcaligenes sp.]|nr:putative transporter small subunit [Paenalcaligenes sp.]